MSDVVDESFGAEMVDDADGSEDVAVAREIGEREVAGNEASDASWSDRVTRRLTHVTGPQLIIAGLIVVYVAYYTQRSLDIHHGFGTASYDSALYDQGVWLLSQGEAPFVTLMGRNLFGDHTSFILLVLVPFYWLWPGAGVLFFSQSLVIGAGAIPVFLYGRRRLGNEWFALVAAAAYLLHPAVGWTNLENFHPDSFLGVFVGFAIYAALERKWRMYALFVVLSLLVKEDASLVIVPLGIWVAMKRSWRIGLATVLGSVAFMAVAMFAVMRSLIGVPTRNTWRFPFSQPDDSTFSAAWRVVTTAFTDPGRLLEHLRSDGRPWYLVQMTAPFAWLFFRLPSVAAISAVVLFTNILSTFWYQYQIEYHYALVAVPALSLGTVYAIGAIKDRWSERSSSDDTTATDPGGVHVSGRALAIAVLAVSTLVTSYMWSPVPWGRTVQFYGDPNNEWANAGRDLIAQVPRDAVLSAHYRITPHTAYRTEIYQFPTPFRQVLYGPDGNVDGPRLPDRAERVEYVLLPTSTDSYPHDDWLLIQEAFELVDVNQYWILWRRVPGIPLPPERLPG